MHWLTCDDAIRGFQSAARSVQHLSVVADHVMLHTDIPCTAHLVLPDDGPPSPVYRWYGQVESRYIVIECEVQAQELELNSVTLLTPFVENVEAQSDWTAILELRGLPRSIQLSRPLFIQSRAPNPKFAVYRPDPRGWNDPIYSAFSHRDAGSFLEYLKNDSWNDSCVVGPLELPGEWTIATKNDSKSRVFGAYPEKHVAIRVACEQSLKDSNLSSLVVSDSSGAHPNDVYYVADGIAVRKTVC